jgi:hypothetical protein
MRMGHSYTVTFRYAVRNQYISGELRGEYLGKTNEGAFAFNLGPLGKFIALPAEFIRHVDPAERRMGPALMTEGGASEG